MADAFTNRYEEFLDGNYDCVDRIVINAYLPGVGGGGGFRNWWRSLYGSTRNICCAWRGASAGGYAAGRRAQRYGWNRL